MPPAPMAAEIFVRAEASAGESAPSARSGLGSEANLLLSHRRGAPPPTRTDADTAKKVQPRSGVAAGANSARAEQRGDIVERRDESRESRGIWVLIVYGDRTEGTSNAPIAVGAAGAIALAVRAGTGAGPLASFRTRCTYRTDKRQRLFRRHAALQLLEPIQHHLDLRRRGAASGRGASAAPAHHISP